MIYLPERDLLTLLLTKEGYSCYYNSLDLSHIKDEFKELYYVYTALDEVHKLVATDITLASLQAYFFTKYPDVNNEIYTDLFKTLQETQIDPTLGVAMLKSIKQRQQALKLSEAAFRFSNGTGDYENIGTQYLGLDNSAQDDTEEFEFVTTSLSSIITGIFKKPGLRWRLDALNKSLGSLRKSNFGFLFARPESGKTTFLASEITHMLTQLKEEDGSIIWLNNEQAGAEVMLRIYQAFFGVKVEQLRSNITKYEQEFKEQTKGKFLLVDRASLEKVFIERLCAKFKPSLVVIDQIDKLKGFDNDREDLRLGAIYIWARELAKLYCPVIGICQADGTGENVKWLTMQHVANAKTSKQAEADWILGMGHVHGEGTQFIRYFNISKNKMIGDSDTLPILRHGRLEVLIEPEIARFKDIIKYGG